MHLATDEIWECAQMTIILILNETRAKIRHRKLSDTKFLWM